MTDGSRGSLNGQYVFDRFNPAAGLTYSASRFASLYFSYSESSRAPTSIELGCADPNEPCNLPNALVSDPPLKQVVTRTLEAGVRGTLENNMRWSAGWFRGENYNDLLFVASEQTGFGYFTNFGQTRRQGVEVNVSGRIKHFTLGGNYTFLDATYQSSQTVDGGSNSVNDGGFGMDGNITVQPGDHIPQIPQNIFKAYAEYQPTAKISVDLDFDAVGRSFARGNENNLDQPDGVYYLGHGFSPGYGVVNLGAHYQFRSGSSFSSRSTICSTIAITRLRNWAHRPSTTPAISSPGHFRRWTEISRSVPRLSSRRARPSALGEEFGLAF